jgi:hypothetical protein
MNLFMDADARRENPNSESTNNFAHMDVFVGELTCETFHFLTEPCLSDAARKLPGLLLIHSRQPIPPPACIPPGARVNDSSPRHETNEINPMHGQQNHLKDA